MSLPSVEGAGTLAGVLALVILELVKQRKNNNGGNPVVKAIDRLGTSLGHTISCDGAQTRQKLEDAHRATDQRLMEHEAREERKWDAVEAALRRP